MTYTSPEIAKAAGITYRQLDIWTTSGYVTPAVETSSGSGTYRLWAAHQVGEVAYIKALKDEAKLLTALSKERK